MKKLIVSFSLLAAFALPSAAQVQFQNSAFTTDTAFNADYFGQGTNFESFGGEGRAGSLAPGGATYEFNINRLNSPGNFQFGVVTGERVWASAVTNQFRLEYSGDATKTISWRVFNNADAPVVNAITTSAVYGNVIQLMIRTAVNNTSRSMLVDNLNFNGTPLTGASSLSNSGTVRDYLRIFNADFTQPWVLTGNATMTWIGANPSGSQINFQIKAMQSVPEPATIGLGLAALAGGLGYWRYRRRSQQMEADADAVPAEADATDGI